MEDRGDLNNYLDLSSLASTSHYDSSAAAGFIQLLSRADTAGRVNSMDGFPGLTPSYSRPSGLHVDLPLGSAINTFAQLHGLHRSWYPGVQNQGSIYADMFGLYPESGNSWGSLSNTSAADQFHSSLPGMTHPIWPPYSDGRSLPFYHQPSIYSDYYASYISSLMSSSPPGFSSSNTAPADYYPPLFLLPIGSAQRYSSPILSYQNQIQDMHKALMLSNPTRAHTMETHFSPAWNQYIHNSSSGHSSPNGSRTFGFNAEPVSTPSGCNLSDSDTGRRCTASNELKQSIKQEPLSSSMRTKMKDVDENAHHIRQERNRMLEPSTQTSKQEITSETKPKKIETISSPIGSECSLDLCNNNNNNNKNNKNNNKKKKFVDISGLTDGFESNSSSLDAISSASIQCRNETMKSSNRAVDCKQYFEEYHRTSSHRQVVDINKNNNQFLNGNKNDKENSNGKSKVASNKNYTSFSVMPIDKCLIDKEAKSDVDTFSATMIPSFQTSNEPTCDSELILENKLSRAKTSAEVISTSSTDYSIALMLSVDDLDPVKNDETKRDNDDAVKRIDVYFEEISNDGIESNIHDRLSTLDNQSTEESSRKNGVTTVSEETHPFKTSANDDVDETDSYQKSFISKTGLEHEISSSVSQPLLSNFVTTFNLLSSKHSVSDNFPSKALTLYVNDSVKLTKTSTDTLMYASNQEIDLAMPRQSMRYQVSHERHNPAQDGSKVHAPTFLPEVCTLPCNTMTTNTLSSGCSPVTMKSPSSAKNVGIVSSKLFSPSSSGHQIERTSSSSLKARNDVFVVRTEKQFKKTGDSGLINESKDFLTMFSGSRTATSLSSLPQDQLQHLQSNSDVSSPSKLSIVGSVYQTISLPVISSFSSSCVIAENLRNESEVTSEWQRMSSLPLKCTNSFLYSNTKDQVSCTLSSVHGQEKLLSSSSQNQIHNRNFTSLSKNDDNIPENLSTKPLRVETEAENLRRQPIKQLFPKTSSRDGYGYRNQFNSQDGFPVNSIPVGIARALQRTVSQPSCSVEENSRTLSSSSDCCRTTKAADILKFRSDVTSSINNNNFSLNMADECNLNKPNSLHMSTSTDVVESAVLSTDKQSFMKNEFESRTHLLSAPFDRRMSSSCTESTGMQWMPFHSSALFPYSINRNQSQNIHENSSFKLAQNSINGGYFLIPVPEISWPSIFSPAVCQGNDVKEKGETSTSTVCKSSMIEIKSPLTSTVMIKSEDLTTDVDETSRHSNSATASQQPDLNSNCSPPKIDSHHPSLPDTPLGRYPIVYSTTRPPYFFCDSQLLVHELSRHKDRTRISVESRGTSPIHRQTTDDKEHSRDKNMMSVDSEIEAKKIILSKTESEHDKIKLNASVQTYQTSVLFPEQDKIFTAEISIQTSDISDTEEEKSKLLKLRKQKSNKKDKNLNFNEKQEDVRNLKDTSNMVLLSDISGDEEEVDEEEVDEVSKTELNETTPVDKNDEKLKEKRDDKTKFDVVSISTTLSQTICCHQETIESRGEENYIQFSHTVTSESKNVSSLKVVDDDDDDELQGLLMLSTIASKQLGIPSVKKFSILDLPLSQFMEEELSPDVISASYNTPKPRFFAKTDNTQFQRHYSCSEEPKLDDFTSAILKSDEGPENMDPMELDLRMKMAEVQMKYKQKQKELARLQRKNNNENKKLRINSRQNISKKLSMSKRSSANNKKNCNSAADTSYNAQIIKKNALQHQMKVEESNGLKLKRKLSLCKMKEENRDEIKTKSSHDSIKLTLHHDNKVTTSSEMKKRKCEEPKKFKSITTVAFAEEMLLLKKKQKQFCFYSYKKNKSLTTTGLNILSKEIKRHKFRIIENKNSKQFKNNKESLSCKRVDDEWYRRRSERIFFHEASVGSSGSTCVLQVTGGEKSIPSSPTKPPLKQPRATSQDSVTKSNRKLELSVTLKPCTQNDIDETLLKCKLSSKRCDSSGDTDSDSDTDDAPLSTFVQKETPPSVKSCVIGKEDLADGLRVLYFKDGLFYEGTVREILAPDVYKVIIDGERSSQQEIMSQEELLDHAILNIRPTSRNQLSEGTRICAHWSRKFSCLYPGTVKSSNEGKKEEDENRVYVSFDDGDNGRIPLQYISMLPPGYPVQDAGAGSCPTELIASRKRRNTSDEPPSDLSHPTRQKPCSIYHRSISVGGSKKEHKKHEKQEEYSCRLNNVSVVKSRQESENTNENKNQKKSHLTLMIKRKQSNVDDDDDDDDDYLSSDDENQQKCQTRYRKIRKSEEDGDFNELSAEKKKNQKTKSQSSEKSTNRSRKRQQKISISSESEEQIGAFRPVSEQWQWFGPGTKRPGMKGRAKKQFYKAIQRGNEILKIGDAAVFVSTEQNKLQYVGCIDSLWETWDGNMVVKVKWFYHPEETKGGKRLLEIRSALYQSSHEDENDVQTVSHKCQVLSYRNFKQFQANKSSLNSSSRSDDVFYLAGTYDPMISLISFEPDVPLNLH